jgi:molybdopterin/thiamine biosynthesis adenylyltransferase/rhodanese-related sulfurtransferase
MCASESPDARYHRQIILPEVGNDGQAKLKQARVLVIGMGGLGSPAALYLAAAGVGTLGIADNDTVETSNLHRQVIHDDRNVGQAKVDSARERLLLLNPDLKVETTEEGITPANAIKLLSRYDLIVDGTDNFPTRYLINDAACLAGKPVVYGSIFQYEGQVSVFDPVNGSPCYRCLFPQPPEPGTVPNCEEAGVFGALCGIVGSWQASEAIKWILGVGEPLTGRMKVLDTLSSRDRLISLKKDPACPLCGQSPSIRSIKEEAYGEGCELPVEEGALPMEIDVGHAVDLLARENPPELLDVREDHERAISKIREGLHIPTGEIQFKWKALPRSRHMIIYCHHGMRSLFVVRFLQEKGYTKVQSLQGGIDAWSQQIDPTVPRY